MLLCLSKYWMSLFCFSNIRRCTIYVMSLLFGYHHELKLITLRNNFYLKNRPRKRVLKTKLYTPCRLCLYPAIFVHLHSVLRFTPPKTPLCSSTAGVSEFRAHADRVLSGLSPGFRFIGLFDYHSRAFVFFFFYIIFSVL